MVGTAVEGTAVPLLPPPPPQYRQTGAGCYFKFFPAVEQDAEARRAFVNQAFLKRCLFDNLNPGKNIKTCMRKQGTI